MENPLPFLVVPIHATKIREAEKVVREAEAKMVAVLFIS